METEYNLRLPIDLQWFAENADGEEKSEEPTSKRLEDARNEGKVAKSQELNSAFTLIALFLLIRFLTTYLANVFIGAFNWFYSLIPDFVEQACKDLSTSNLSGLFLNMIILIAEAAAPFMLVGFVIALVVSIVQVGWKVTSKPLMPKFSKMNPINGFKRIFSMESLFNLVKSILKVVLIFAVVYIVLRDQLNVLYILYEVSLNQAIAIIGEIVLDIGLYISIVYLILAFVDFYYQKRKFHKDMMMTKKEVKDEYKNTEGDPQIKGRQRQRMREASQRRMMQDIPKADVVITNPTHIAVALRYDSNIESAPTVLAKGEDYLAQRIKEEAKEYDIPIVENKPLARAIYTTVEIGEQIPPELYQSVAEILAVIYQNRS